MCIKFPHGHVRKRSQILMLGSKPLFFWPRRILSFSLRTSLFDSQLLIVYRVFFCLQLETSLSVSGPAKKRRTHFLWSKLFIHYFFSFVVFNFTEGEKEERLLPVFEAMNHRNLHYHTVLQAVHWTRNKSRNSFTQKDNVVTVCQFVWHSVLSHSQDE